MQFHETRVTAWSYVTVDQLIKHLFVEDFQSADCGLPYRLLSTWRSHAINLVNTKAKEPEILSCQHRWSFGSTDHKICLTNTSTLHTDTNKGRLLKSGLQTIITVGIPAIYYLEIQRRNFILLVEKNMQFHKLRCRVTWQVSCCKILVPSSGRNKGTISQKSFYHSFIT